MRSDLPIDAEDLSPCFREEVASVAEPLYALREDQVRLREEAALLEDGSRQEDLDPRP